MIAAIDWTVMGWFLFIALAFLAMMLGMVWVTKE